MSITSFPRQDVSEAEKNKDDKAWYKQGVDYGASRYCNGYAIRQAKIVRMQNSYNGVVSEAEFAYLNRSYGAENTVGYIDYRLCRAKIDLLVGEELGIPLNGTIYTTNPEAHVQRLEEIAVPVGMHAAADQVEKLRTMVGVDVFNGLKAPEVPEGKSIFDTLSKKSQNETIMQYISNRQIDAMKLKLRLNDNFLDATLNSECFGKVYINSDGEVQMRSIAIENALFDEGQRDQFLDNSPGLGERRIMFYHEILKEFNLTKVQADELWEMQATPPSDDSFVNINYPRIGGALAYSVYTYEWIGLQSERVKVYVDVKTGEEKTAFLSSDYYDANEKKLRKEESKGKYKIITKYKYVLYEATRIGHQMYVNMGPVENMPASISNPAWTTRRYVGMLFGTVGGTRISIKQMTEHIDKTYNLIMYQINRELHKAKGKVLVLNSAAANAKESLVQRLYRVTNDGVIEWNSAEDGNEGARNIEQAIGVDAIDLGISSSINTLIPLKVDLEQTADRITGILQNRMGNIAASATVSNTQQSVQASRTTTAGLFYFFGEYIERIMRLTLEFSKISYGVLRQDIGDMVLGVEKMQFLKMTPDFAFQDYGYKLGDIMKEMEVRNMLREWAPIVLNSQPEMVETFMEAAWTETVAEVQGKIRNAFKKINEAKQAEAMAQNEAAMQQKQVMVEGQQQVQQTKNEGDLAKVAAQGQVATAIEGQKGKNAAILQRNQAAHAPEKTARK